MKGKGTTDYPHGGYPPKAGCNWLKVDFEEEGKPVYPEKNPRVRLRSTETQPTYDLGVKGWTWVTEVEGMVENH